MTQQPHWERRNTATHRSPIRYNDYNRPTYGPMYIAEIRKHMNAAGYHVVQTETEFDSIASSSKRCLKFEMAIVIPTESVQSYIEVLSNDVRDQLSEQSKGFLDRLQRYTLTQENTVLFFEVLSLETTSPKKKRETTVLCVMYAHQIIPGMRYQSQTRRNETTATNTTSKQRATAITTEV